jgi:hypothetical protein
MTKTFLTNLMRHSMVLAAVLSVGWFAMPSQATMLACATPVLTTQTVIPSDCTGLDGGTLLASRTDSWNFSPSSTTSGTLSAAVYRNSTGTLDFYYQVFNASTSPTTLRAESNVDFTGFLTSVGFDTTGMTDLGAPFANAGNIPETADRPSPGSVVGFNFNVSGFDFILAGESSAVLIVSTNATNYTTGFSEILDGGSATVPTYQPAAVPEPMSLMLLGSSLLGLGMLVRRQKKA